MPTNRASIFICLVIDLRLRNFFFLPPTITPKEGVSSRIALERDFRDAAENALCGQSLIQRSYRSFQPFTSLACLQEKAAF